MSKVPCLNYEKVVHALRRNGWIVVRQKGSHIRMQKATVTSRGRTPAIDLKDR